MRVYFLMQELLMCDVSTCSTATRLARSVCISLGDRGVMLLARGESFDGVRSKASPHTRPRHCFMDPVGVVKSSDHV